MSWTLSPADKAWGLIGVEMKALPTRILGVDAEGGTRPNPAWVSARDFPTLADALASIPASGGELYIPSGTYKLASTLTIDRKHITLRGDGPCTVLEPTTPGAWPLVELVAGADHCRICDLLLDGLAFGAGGASALVIEGSPPQLDPPIPSKPVTSTQLENLVVRNAANYGMELRLVDILYATNCEFVLGKSGVLIDGTGVGGTVIATQFIGCQISTNKEYGVVAVGNVTLLQFELCTIANNVGVTQEIHLDPPAPPTYTVLDTSAAHIDLDLAPGVPFVRFSSCHFEHTRPAPPLEWPDAVWPNALNFIRLVNAPGTVVDGCWFNSQNSVDVGVLVWQGSDGTRVSNCMGWLFPVWAQPGDPYGALAHFVAPGVQFANRELEPTGPARILGSNPGFFYGTDPVSDAAPPPGVLNTGVGFLYTYSSTNLPAAGDRPRGTMILVEHVENNVTTWEIRVSDGISFWKKVTLS